MQYNGGIVNHVPIAFVVALATQMACQLFKLVYYSIKDGRFSPRYFVSAGGFPSAHSAFVTALTVSIGLRSGPGTDAFAVALVLSLIVIYDAYRLRGFVEALARRVNHLARAVHGNQEPLPEMIGHSLPEIVTGIVVGALLAGVATVVW